MGKLTTSRSPGFDGRFRFFSFFPRLPARWAVDKCGNTPSYSCGTAQDFHLFPFSPDLFGPALMVCCGVLCYLKYHNPGHIASPKSTQDRKRIGVAADVRLRLRCCGHASVRKRLCRTGQKHFDMGNAVQQVFLGNGPKPLLFIQAPGIHLGFQIDAVRMENLSCRADPLGQDPGRVIFPGTRTRKAQAHKSCW